MKFGIKGFDRMSLLDWDGMVATTLYLPGCNFRCPYCHNAGLVLAPEEYETIPLKDILSYIEEHNDFLDGAVITGGEPTIHPHLAELVESIRDAGLRVKLDTNGSAPDVVEYLIDSELIDYVAMDVKAPLDYEAYSRSAGIADRDALERVRDTIDLLMEGRVEYEFRMTVVPALHRATDLERVASQIEGARRFVLQSYIARDTLDPEFLNEAPYNHERLEEFRDFMDGYVEDCILRGDE